MGFYFNQTALLGLPTPSPLPPSHPRLIDRQLAEVDSIVELILTSDATEELFICVLSFTQRDGLFTLGNGLYFVSVWTMHGINCGAAAGAELFG